MSSVVKFYLNFAFLEISLENIFRFLRENHFLSVALTLRVLQGDLRCLLRIGVIHSVPILNSFE